MNIVLFQPGEWRQPLPRLDARAAHLVDILKLVPGDRFAAGEIGAWVGTLEYVSHANGVLEMANPIWDSLPPPLGRVHLLIGTPRPPTARRLLNDLTTLGSAELHFVATDLGDKSYLQSTLWKGEYFKNLWEGAAQARTTLVPRIELHTGLRRTLVALEERTTGPKIWFDEGGTPWDRHPAHESASSGALWLALGPERGWSAAERGLFADQGWQLAGLGERVLRTETACSLALGIAMLKGWG